jgi:hypothetical protein
MRIGMLRRAVDRLAVLSGSNGPCPICAGAEPIPLRDGQEAPTCEFCGRELPAVKLIRDHDFYRNADRLPANGA